MSREQDNKAVVGRWFDGFWGNPWNPGIIDELAAPNMDIVTHSIQIPAEGAARPLFPAIASLSMGALAEFHGLNTMRSVAGRPKIERSANPPTSYDLMSRGHGVREPKKIARNLGTKFL